MPPKPSLASVPINSWQILTGPSHSEAYPLTPGQPPWSLHPASTPGQTTTKPTRKPRATSPSLSLLICSPHSSHRDLFKMLAQSCRIVQNFPLACISLGINTKSHKMNPKALQSLALPSSSLSPLLPALCSPGKPSSPIAKPGTISPQGLCTCYLNHLVCCGHPTPHPAWGISHLSSLGLSDRRG